MTHAERYSTDNAVSFIVPFDRNLNFSGGTQLAEVEAKLFVGGQTTKVAITGLGGIGKTQLVLELVYRISDRNKDCSVIWIPATNTESLHQAYREVARQHKIPGSNEDKADAKKLVQDYLSKEDTGPWIVVFDNADNVNMWIDQSGTGPGSGRLIDYLPRSERGCIVFTTRDRKTAVKLARQNVIEIRDMEEDIAIQLLRKSLINPDLVNNRPDTVALLKELTYLPLAIVQAAAYINENGITFADYLSLLAEQEEDVIDLLSETFEDDGRYHDMKNPVAITWLISFEQIQQRDLLAADYLSFMACIDSKDIPQSLLPAGLSRKKEIDAIGTLDAYSFITKRSADQALDLHRLVHLATRNWLRKQELITQWTRKAIMRLEEVFPDNDHQNRSIWRIYLPHVQSVLKSDVREDLESRDKLVWRFGMCLSEDGRYNEAEKQFLEAYETRKRVLGLEHPVTLISMGNLASTYWNQGRWKEAAELGIYVIELEKRVLGLEHPNTLISISNLASTYRNQGRWKEAAELGIYMVETEMRVLGLEHPTTLTSIGNFASTYLDHATYLDHGRRKEAEKLVVHVTETMKRVLGPEHPTTLTNMGNLSKIYTGQCRWKEAKELVVHVMETRKRVLGPDHPATLTSMDDLAMTYWDQGRWNEATEFGDAGEGDEREGARPRAPDMLPSIDDLATIYQNQGRWKVATEVIGAGNGNEENGARPGASPRAD